MRNFILAIVGIVFGTIAHAEILIGFGAPALDGGQRAIMNGFVSKAEEKGWEVVVSNANSDAQQQANQLDNFIAQGVDAIVTVPVDSKAVCSSVERAQDAGILCGTGDEGLQRPGQPRRREPDSEGQVTGVGGPTPSPRT